MTATVNRPTEHTAPGRTTHGIDQEIAQRLLDSAETLSYDPIVDIDWDAPLDPSHYGLNPEWSTLYGTPLWEEMTEEQRVALTRHEVSSIMNVGIWFEMILQQMVIREMYATDPSRPEFQFALTEVADECRHSIMFARCTQRLGIEPVVVDGFVGKLGNAYKSLAKGEAAYGAILVAEEVLDVMQRDWMRDERVLPMVRESSRIHVVEESRHMKFAREEMRQHLSGISARRRRHSAFLIAAAAYFIVSSMVSPRVYKAVGLDTERALQEVKDNEHRKAMMRSSSAHLMDFLGECGLLTPAAVRIYQRLNML